MEVSKRLCFCLDVGAGSLLAGIYTTALSVIFMGLGIEDLVLITRRSVGGQDIVTLTSVYGLLIALSLLYGISSIALLMGASRKIKLYLIPWLLLTPMWSMTALAALIILPLEMPRAVRLSDSSTRLAGTLVVLVLNTFSMVCVSVLLYVFCKTPRNELKSHGVAETFSSSFKNAGHSVRQSFRPKKKPAVTYSKNAANAIQVTIPHLGAPVLLQPSCLEVVRSEQSQMKARSAAARSRQQEELGGDPLNVGEKMNVTLTSSEQLSCPTDMPGLDNPSFLSEYD